MIPRTKTARLAATAEKALSPVAPTWIVSNHSNIKENILSKLFRKRNQKMNTPRHQNHSHSARCCRGPRHHTSDLRRLTSSRKRWWSSRLRSIKRNDCYSKTKLMSKMVRRSLVIPANMKHARVCTLYIKVKRSLTNRARKIWRRYLKGSLLERSSKYRKTYLKRYH